MCNVTHYRRLHRDVPVMRADRRSFIERPIRRCTLIKSGIYLAYMKAH